MNSVKWKNLSLKYQRFTPSGGKKYGHYKIRVGYKDSIPLQNQKISQVITTYCKDIGIKMNREKFTLLERYNKNI